MVAGLKNSRSSSKPRVKAQSPPNITVMDRDPTTRDYFNFTRGDIWLNGGTTAAPVVRIWMLFRQTNNIATWILLASGSGGDISQLTASDGTIAIPLLGNITFPDQVIPGAGTIDSNLQSNVNPNLGFNFTFNLKPAIRLPLTNAALTQGVIYIGVNRFIHAYGTANTFIGNASGNNTLTTASATSNTAIGNSTLISLTTGADNTVGGSNAAIDLTTGSNNSIWGDGAAANLTTGSNNCIVGQDAADLLLTGSNNVIIGRASGSAYTTSESSNILISNAGVVLDGNLIRIGTFGAGAGQQTQTFLHGGQVFITNGNLNLPTTTATTGQVVIGVNRFVHAFGTSNTFVGDAAGPLSGTSSSNVGLGTGSLSSLSSGSNNAACGWENLQVCTTGSNNSSLGSGVLTSLTTGSSNTGVGSGAFSQVGSGLVSGSFNTGIGHDAGSNYTGAETNNILINNDGVVGESGNTRIGTAGDQVKCFIAGIRGVTTDVNDAIAVLIDSAGQLGTVSSSKRYKQNIEDLAEDSEIVMHLRPVKFNYKKHPDIPAWGLIAEEVELVFPQLVVYDKDGNAESVKYHELVPLLLNEVQKLNKRVKELENKDE